MNKQRQSLPKAERDRFLDTFLKAVQHWTPDEVVQSLLGVSDGSEGDVLLSAAAALCMLNRDGSEPNRTWIASLLDAVAAHKHPAAEQVLFRLTRDGRNTRIRMEATRRLGSVAVSQDAKGGAGDRQLSWPQGAQRGLDCISPMSCTTFHVMRSAAPLFYLLGASQFRPGFGIGFSLRLIAGYCES